MIIGIALFNKNLIIRILSGSPLTPKSEGRNNFFFLVFIRFVPLSPSFLYFDGCFLKLEHAPGKKL
jgi:hypothetical protein